LWDQQIFAGSGIKILIDFGIRDQNLGKNMGPVTKNIPRYDPVIGMFFKTLFICKYSGLN